MFLCYYLYGGNMIEQLNDMQRKAVTTTEGPLLVLAGAGSGKTKVLTSRIAYLLKEKNVSPDNILAITFTNKAAKEMKTRVVNLIGNVGYSMRISTFHSLGLSILKEHYDLIGYEKNFTILDSDDSLSLIKKIVKDLDLDPKFFNPKMIRNKISGAKNELMDSCEYMRYANTDIEEKIVKVYERYEKRLKANNSFDFDDLLMLPIKILRENPSVLKNYQEKFKYVLVDEYQDTNQAQYILTKMLSAKYNNLCVVGDNDQSIYMFRGANYRNILNFEKDYKNASVIMLEENYRSTKNILNVANDIIKNNKARKEKVLWTNNPVGDKIKYKRASNEKDESIYVVREIEKLINNGEPLSEIAVLYRANAQSRNIEEALLRENIPYKVVGAFYFYNRKEIKDLIAYLKLIYNSNDDNSLMRIINVPKRGIGLKSIENLSVKAVSNNTSMFDALETQKELEFKCVIENLKEKSESLSLTELVDEILKQTGMQEELELEKTIEAEVRLENLEEFKTITKSFEEREGLVSLEQFLDEISLVSDVEEYKNNTNVVTLMTIHSAKGLEFDNVFLIGMEEGLFPHSNCLNDNEEIEEERRLCYVAVTRAKKNLVLVNARSRVIYGKENYNIQSRFIDEISHEYLEKDGFEDAKPFNRESVIDDSVEYKIGDKVIHDIYGEGIIVEVKQSILTIAFSHKYGIIKMMKGHKSIRKV